MKHRVRQITEGKHYRGRIEIGKGVCKFYILLKESLQVRGVKSHVIPSNVSSLKIEMNGSELRRQDAIDFFKHLIFEIVAHMNRDPLIRELNRRVRKANKHAMEESAVKHFGNFCVSLLIEFQQQHKEKPPFAAEDLKMLNELGCELS